MIQARIHPAFPRRISTLSAAPNAVTTSTSATCLLFTPLLAALLAIPASAQQAGVDGYEAGVISNTVEHAAPGHQGSLHRYSRDIPEAGARAIAARIHSHGRHGRRLRQQQSYGLVGL